MPPVGYVYDPLYLEHATTGHSESPARLQAVIHHLEESGLLGRLTLIDRDIYEAANLLSQNIRRNDVGRPKALAQRDFLRTIRQDLTIHAIHKPIENVPWGRLQSDLILAALDSRISRLSVSRIAWRLGIRHIDSGILKDGLLARVSSYKPSDQAPCLECMWSASDYEAVEVRYPCDPEPAIPSTDAPQCLGALAASLQAIEAVKILDSGANYDEFSTEVFVEGRSRGQHLSKLVKNPACRFDHQRIPEIIAVPVSTETSILNDLVKIVEPITNGTAIRSLSVEGQSFAGMLVCTDCGTSSETLQLEPRLTRTPRVCPKCNNQMVAPGFFESEDLLLSDLTCEQRALPMAAVGILPGDILRVGLADSANKWILIDGDCK